MIEHPLVAPLISAIEGTRDSIMGLPQRLVLEGFLAASRHFAKSSGLIGLLRYCRHASLYDTLSSALRRAAASAHVRARIPRTAFLFAGLSCHGQTTMAWHSETPISHSDVVLLQFPLQAIVCSSCAAAYFQQTLICGYSHSLVHTLADADKRAHVRS